MEKVIGTWIAFQAHMLVRRNERGQGTLEYVGMVIVAAIVIGLVVTVAKGSNIATGFSSAVDKVLAFNS